MSELIRVFIVSLDCFYLLEDEERRIKHWEEN